MFSHVSSSGEACIIVNIYKVQCSAMIAPCTFVHTLSTFEYMLTLKMSTPDAFFFGGGRLKWTAPVKEVEQFNLKYNKFKL